ncbi:MAG TPA: DUF3301 domain-containing protein [Salinisphaeraceae bacterium]|nr:DUF3301 domain-containing protein [Salinisphaeraceae bacterium]
MDTLPWLLVAAIVALVWWDALGAKKTARRAARRACAEAEVRFIDELALRRLTLRRVRLRNGQRPWRIRRLYQFEFYWHGTSRHSGQVIMHGQQVVSVQLDPYPLQD